MTGPVPLHLLLLADALDLRRQRGIDTYRGGNAALPFVGDPAAEAFEEALDLVVYAEEMRRQGGAEAVAARVEVLGREAARILGDHLRDRV